MTTATLTPPTPTTPSVSRKRGFAVPCLHCRETGYVQVRLNDMTCAEDDFFCASCEEYFSREDVSDFVEKWGKCLAWLETAPALAE